MSTISASTTSTTAFKITTDTTGALVFQTGASPTTAVTFDASQNVGIGVTPSAWGGNLKALEFPGGNSLVSYGTTGDLLLQSNAYYNGTNYIYKTSTYASAYETYQGKHIWLTAASGTAGNTITFTQAMTLDASGNWFLGGTTNSGAISGRNLLINCPAGQANKINFNVNGGNEGFIYHNATELSLGAPAGGALQFQIAGSGTVGKFDSSGNLGIGTTSPAAKLQVNASNFALATSYATLTSNAAIRTTDSAAANVGGELALGGYNNGTSNASDFVRLHGKKENGTAGNVSGYFAIEVANDSGPAPYIFEAMRINSSGKVLAGVTGAVNSAHTFSVSQANSAFIVQNAGTGGIYGLQVRYSAADPNNTVSSYLELYSASSGVLRGEIRSNGGLANYSANNVNLSDRREKTNFAPAGDYLSKICAIPVQTFNYIDQNLEEDDGLTLGVVAQDVQAVAPELVMESNWGTRDAPKMRLSIYQTDLQYALMKAIQELNAKVIALENK